MLIENTLFGKRDKVQIAIDRIREFEPPEGYYVAFSGGKDSEVVLDLVKRAGVKWDEQNHLPQFWAGILGEEYGELCQAINETVFDNGEEERKKGGYENMHREAIHVAAVAVGFLECLERNRGYYCDNKNA